MEPLWRNGTEIERPFSAVAGVSGRCRSLPLQRVMTDFGADHAFAPAAAKLKEHYGIEMPVSSVQRTTEHHAHCIYEQEVARVIDELRQMGNDVLTAWAERGVERSVVVAQAEPDWRPGGKKNCIGTPLLVRSR